MSIKTQITDELYQYVVKFGTKEHPILTKLREVTYSLPNAHMQITVDQAGFMGLLDKIMNAKSYLEVGVFTGYSALAMMLAMGPEASATVLDNNADYLETARKFWAEAHVDGQITSMLGNAKDSLELLRSAKPNTSHIPKVFDIAFIDANKTECLIYYEHCYQLVKSGGIILVDNVLSRGKVLDTNGSPNSAKPMHQFNQYILDDARVTSSMLSIADGLTVIYKH